MPLNLASPGILIREVDLTQGRVDATSDKIGGIVGPFAKGPVGTPTRVNTENDLVGLFGKPYDTDKHYETWMTASSYLAYGGIMNVIRADDANLKNATDGTASIKVKSVDHYEELNYNNSPKSGVTVIAKNPGSWANDIRVAIIDGKADQILTMDTDGVVESTFTEAIANRSATIATGAATTVGISTASITLGQHIRGNFVSSGTTVTAIGTEEITLANATSNTEGGVTVPLDFGVLSETTVLTPLAVGVGVTQAVPSGIVVTDLSVGVGTALLDGHFKGIVTGIPETGKAEVKIVSHVSASGVEKAVDYNSIYQFSTTGSVAIHTAGQAVSYGTTTVTATTDWFSQQTFATHTATVGGASTVVTVKWNSVADVPGTSNYANDRGGRHDELHVVVIDASGGITGNAGTILEKHLNLSKATDAEFSVGSSSYWNNYLQNNSEYIFAGSGDNQTLRRSGFSASFTSAATSWNTEVEDSSGANIFDCVGALDLTLTGGKNYGGKSTLTEDNALDSGLDNLLSGYGLFENDSEVDVDFLLMGSGKYGEASTRALAAKLIAVAELRKDAIAFISPHRSSIITDASDGEDGTTALVKSADDATNNVIKFFDPLTSSSYAIFDSGYKYMYDRFNDVFRYVPLNGDIAGTCARNDINNFPWFSPAGTSRGTILNAVKLAYNPGKLQRDRLYSSRVNPVIFSPGSGIILFGDKTGFAKSSAFDRINVRRLFIFLEDAIAAAAKDQLFEFNDEITRANFVNIVEPFLRDVQAKRGITDFVVICDETNNTAAIIDSNEFVADIYIKPARSINFIGLNFIATRTGVSFEEVIGSV